MKNHRHLLLPCAEWLCKIHVGVTVPKHLLQNLLLLWSQGLPPLPQISMLEATIQFHNVAAFTATRFYICEINWKQRLRFLCMPSIIWDICYNRTLNMVLCYNRTSIVCFAQMTPEIFALCKTWHYNHFNSFDNLNTCILSLSDHFALSLKKTWSGHAGRPWGCWPLAARGLGMLAARG